MSYIKEADILQADEGDDFELESGGSGPGSEGESEHLSIQSVNFFSVFDSDDDVPFLELRPSRQSPVLCEDFEGYTKSEMEEECEESASLPVRYRPESPAALARASRFTPHEIKLMYRGFKQECPTGMVDEESFKNIFSQFFPLG
ncbi:unnamed protein product, partial [Parnassius apollo]